MTDTQIDLESLKREAIEVTTGLSYIPGYFPQHEPIAKAIDWLSSNNYLRLRQEPIQGQSYEAKAAWNRLSNAYSGFYKYNLPSDIDKIEAALAQDKTPDLTHPENVLNKSPFVNMTDDKRKALEELDHEFSRKILSKGYLQISSRHYETIRSALQSNNEGLLREARESMVKCHFMASGSKDTLPDVVAQEREYIKHHASQAISKLDKHLGE